MAATAFSKLAHPIHGSRKSCYKAEPLNEEQKEKEKQFLLEFHANASPLSPEQITLDPKSKELGAASKQLHKEDFDMMTTLGTGALHDHHHLATGAITLTLGRDLCSRLAGTAGGMC